MCILFLLPDHRLILYSSLCIKTHMGLGLGPDGNLYGGTILPYDLFHCLCVYTLKCVRTPDYGDDELGVGPMNYLRPS